MLADRVKERGKMPGDPASSRRTGTMPVTMRAQMPTRPLARRQPPHPTADTAAVRLRNAWSAASATASSRRSGPSASWTPSSGTTRSSGPSSQTAAGSCRRSPATTTCPGPCPSTPSRSCTSCTPSSATSAGSWASSTPPARSWRACARSTARWCDLLTHRGTPAFAEISERLYGSASDSFHAGDPNLADLGHMMSDILDNLSHETIFGQRGADARRPADGGDADGAAGRLLSGPGGGARAGCPTASSPTPRPAATTSRSAATPASRRARSGCWRSTRAGSTWARRSTA